MFYLFIAHIGPQYSSSCSFVLIRMHGNQHIITAATRLDWNSSQMIDIVGDLCLKMKIIKFFNWISFIISSNSFERCSSNTTITALWKVFRTLEFKILKVECLFPIIYIDRKFSYASIRISICISKIQRLIWISIISLIQKHIDWPDC